MYLRCSNEAEYKTAINKNNSNRPEWTGSRVKRDVFTGGKARRSQVRPENSKQTPLGGSTAEKPPEKPILTAERGPAHTQHVSA